MLANLLEYLFGGTRGFNDAESRLLSFVSESLPPEEQRIWEQQIRSVRKVQRQIPGQLIAVYYQRNAKVPPLPYPGYEHCLATVTYLSRGRARTTSLVLHDGRFMTFERNVPQRLGDIEALQSIVLHPKGFKSVAPEIDGQEHRESGAGPHVD